MPRLSSKLYVCPQCGNRFLRRTGDVMSKCDLPVCMECGGTLVLQKPSFLRYFDLWSWCKGVKHLVKCLLKGRS